MVQYRLRVVQESLRCNETDIQVEAATPDEAADTIMRAITGAEPAEDGSIDVAIGGQDIRLDPADMQESSYRRYCLLLDEDGTEGAVVGHQPAALTVLATEIHAYDMLALLKRFAGIVDRGQIGEGITREALTEQARDLIALVDGHDPTLDGSRLAVLQRV